MCTRLGPPCRSPLRLYHRATDRASSALTTHTSLSLPPRAAGAAGGWDKRRKGHYFAQVDSRVRQLTAEAERTTMDAFLLAALVVCGLFWSVGACMLLRASKLSRRLQREMELHAPLMSNEHRLDAALRDAEEGYNKCSLCGFENFKRFAFCNVCGDEIYDEECEKKKKKKKAGDVKRLWKSRKKGSIEILSRASAIPRSTTRQQRARKRKEWTRRLDGDGKVVWHRDCVNIVSVDAKFPGYLVRFFDAVQVESDTGAEAESAVQEEVVADEDEESKENVVVVVVDPVEGNSTSGEPLDTEQPAALSEAGQSETGAPLAKLLTKVEVLDALLKSAAGMTMTLVESSASDPAHLSVVSASDTGLQWRDVMTLAAQVFPAKYAHFVTMTAAITVPAVRELLRLKVNRDQLFEDSMESLSVIPASSIRSVMRITFADEVGIDAGGLYREWFVLLNEQLAGGSCGIFQCVNKEEQTFYLNPNSKHDIGENHLMYYFATGRLIGRALLEGSVIGFHLSLPLIKIMLGLPVTLSDLEYFDPETYKSLLWMLENDDVGALGLDFSVTEKRRNGEVVVVDLIPNGRSIDVTDDNKDEYVERQFRYMLFESVSSQLYVFLKGLYEVIPQELLMLFDPEEFDYLLCGSDEIDVDDWERNAKYLNIECGHPALLWFWELVREMPNEYRQRLLHFATGSSRVPIAGFSSLTSYDGRLCPFTLNGVPLVNDGYIWSHACFNRLDLPYHVSRDDLKAVLYAALDTELYGFTTK